VFHTTPREEVEVLSILDFIKNELGLTKVGVLYDAQPYGTGNLAHIENLAPGLGLEIVAKESIENGDTDAIAQLERLRDAGVEVLIVWVGDPAASSAAKGADQIAWDVEMIGSSAIAGPTFPELAGAAGEGVYSDGAFNFDDPPPNQAPFLANYQAKYDAFPTQFAAFAYDSAFILKAAIEFAGGDTSSDAIRQAVIDMPPFEGVTATYDFTEEDHNGLGLSPLFYIVQVQDGQYRVVYKSGG
jgi:branched-chain amino acid transport system substrate-binding protein